ncbi:MFS multidrug transporter (fluconazole resistance protein) [Colletotrichum tofieldiae]|uniref:MFS multidrug transporter (Fluconazole resistance protein) n=1 Tax=Colletotrichum tofieldiae TaxID=708197 RepID=A0A166QA58_9PEZI|nr:MFS multidrug transporter (fluconazole resistance protein) [Colletotrichum tofieldiae]
MGATGPDTHHSWTLDGRCHPRQWGRARKAYDTCLILFLEFYTTTISTAGAPVANQACEDLGISPVQATFVFVSVYLIGQSVGGIFFPPWSESFGRKNFYIISTALYSLFCLMIAVSTSIPGVVVGRFATGVLSSIPTVVITGSIEDLWDTRARVWWVFWWVLVGNLGLLTGPMISDGILGHSHWKWVFYTAAIVTACLACLLFTIKESRLSVLLLIVAPAATEAAPDQASATRTPNRREKLDLLRPLRLLVTEPIVFLVSIVTAVSFGLIYLFTEVLPMIYLAPAFGASPKNVPFLAIGLGTFLSIFTRGYDIHVLARRSAKSLPMAPENKLAGFVIGAPLLAVSLWWFAWTIPPFIMLHWAIPTTSLILTGYALNEFNYVLAGYLTDCYQRYAASSVGAMAITRSLFSAVFPLFGKAPFRSLGFNVASTVLAIVATVLCVVPPLFLRYGAILRGKSVFAQNQQVV